MLNNIASQASLRKLQKKRKKGSHVYDETKATVQDLSNDVFICHVFPRLQVPDLICLALTCKELAAQVLLLRPSVNDDATVIEVHASAEAHILAEKKHGWRTVVSKFLHLSSRTQLMVQLADYMPRGFRLCWVCKKYTRTSSSQWHRILPTKFFKPIDNAVAKEMYPQRLYCHHSCKSDHRSFRRYVGTTAGAQYFEDSEKPLLVNNEVVGVYETRWEECENPACCPRASGRGQKYWHNRLNGVWENKGELPSPCGLVYDWAGQAF